MSDEIETLKAELEKVRAELKAEKENNNLKEVKAKYEEIIEILTLPAYH